MPLQVTKEPSGTLCSGVMERCCLCRAETRFWFTPKDVALCEDCSKAAEAKDIPSKADWFKKERALRLARSCK